MKLARLLLMTATLFAMSTGIASAVPVTFQLDNITAAGGLFASSQTPVGGFPIVGSGNIDFGAGTGTLTLPNYSVLIDVQLNGNDAQLDISGWSQTITSIDGGGNITSTGGGTTVCTDLTAGGIGLLVCNSLPAGGAVQGWPPVNGASLVSSAIIDTGLQTITVIDNSNAAGGTITSFYSYTIVPEPSTGLLVLGGLVAIAHRRRA